MTSIQNLRTDERAAEFKHFLYLITFGLGIPLWLLCWIEDLVYIPHLKWDCLAVRSFIVVLLILTKPIFSKINKSLNSVQVLGTFCTLIHSAGLNYLTFITGGAASPYSICLNLITSAQFAFLPWTRRTLVLNVFITYAPLYFMYFFTTHNQDSGRILFVYSIYSFSSLVVTLVLRYFMEQLRTNDFKSRFQLQEVVTSRDHEIERKTKEMLSLEVSASLGKMASQIAHDIRSPLAALRSVSPLFKNLPEEDRIILRSAVDRIHDIAQELVNPTGENSQAQILDLPGTSPFNEVMHLPSLVESVLTEKRLQYRTRLGIEMGSLMNSDHYGVFITFNRSEFKRILSNLINNAVEALGDKGKVELDLTVLGNQISLSLSDNGKGIPSEIIANLGQRGFTYGKEGGSGLGLFHAQSLLSQQGGNLTIQSEVGRGTTVSLHLPMAKAPVWFVERLEVKGRPTKIVVVDDDQAIHHLWERRFSERLSNANTAQMIHFFVLADFENYVRSMSHSDEVMFLIDYEFKGEDKCGLTAIEELGIVGHSILVTSLHEDSDLLRKCETLGLRLIPKDMARMVPIENGSSSTVWRETEVGVVLNGSWPSGL